MAAHQQVAAIGYQGIELGRKFPRELSALQPLLQEIGLSPASGWFSGTLADISGGGLGYFDVKVLEVHDLVQGICRDDDCYPNFTFGWENQRLLQAIEDSMAQRRWVTVRRG